MDKAQKDTNYRTDSRINRKPITNQETELVFKKQ